MTYGGGWFMNISTYKILTFREVWKESVKLFTSTFHGVWYVALLSEIAIMCVLAISIFIPQINLFFRLLLVILLFMIDLYFEVLILHRIDGLSSNSGVSLIQSFIAVGRKYHILLVAALFVAVVSLTGLALFIVPGIFLWISFLFFRPLVIFADKNIWDSIKGSYFLVKNNWWHTFAVMGSITLVFLGLYYVLICASAFVLSFWLTFLSVVTSHNLLIKDAWFYLIDRCVPGIILLPLYVSFILTQYRNLQARAADVTRITSLQSLS